MLIRIVKYVISAIGAGCRLVPAVGAYYALLGGVIGPVGAVYTL